MSSTMTEIRGNTSKVCGDARLFKRTSESNWSYDRRLHNGTITDPKRDPAVVELERSLDLIRCQNRLLEFGAGAPERSETQRRITRLELLLGAVERAKAVHIPKSRGTSRKQLADQLKALRAERAWLAPEPRAYPTRFDRHEDSGGLQVEGTTAAVTTSELIDPVWAIRANTKSATELFQERIEAEAQVAGF